MYAVVDTDKMLADQVLNPSQVNEIKLRARDTMITLAINMVLCFGILSATGGLIFWLASPVSVAVCGLLFLGAGLLILRSGNDLLRMFGNAATLIGAGMMIGGAAIELMDKYEEIAGPVMLVAGALIAGIAAVRKKTGSNAASFVIGAIMLMGAAMHLTGGYQALSFSEISGLPVPLFHVYSAIIVALAGWFLNIRLVTALAIIPFAQALQTGTYYMHAMYAFYSPESTLTIVQMTLLVTASLWFAGRTIERHARHARIMSVMAFIVANLAALVGSLFGDRIGENIWGPGRRFFKSGFETVESWQEAHTAFLENAWVISNEAYAFTWAVALAGMIAFSAHKNNRGLFNASMTFAGLHVYTQMFERFGDEPLVWVIGGLAAIPIAWGMWRLNIWFTNRELPQASNG